jgi:hypothetical protein
MTFSLGQGFFDLPENGGNRSAFSFEEAQMVPQPDDFAFSLGAHRGSLTDRATVNEKRTNGKPLGIGAEPDKATRRFARRDGQPLSMSI